MFVNFYVHRIFSCLLAFIFLLISTSANAARVVQTLLIFDKGGATLESEYEPSAMDAQPGSLIANAMEVEASIVALSTSEVSNPTQLPVVEPENITLSSVIQLAASDASYQGAWVWGNYGLVQSTYDVNGREIDWRSDFRCVADTNCRMYTSPLPQLFEASFLLLKEAGARREDGIIESIDDSIQITARWDSPDSVITVDQDSAQNTIKRSLKWQWQLPELDHVLTRGQGNSWSLPVSAVNDSTGIAKMVGHNLGRWLESPSILNSYRQYESLRVYNYQVNSSQVLERRQLATYDQLESYIDTWKRLLLIAHADFGDTGLIYVRPDRSSKDESQMFEEPVFVFQYVREGAQLILLPGILFDPRVELMSNIDFLEAMRRALRSKG